MVTSGIDRIAGVRTAKAIKTPVLAATTANITLSGEQTIDGVAVVADDRVLVKDQTDQTENGIYDAASGAWARAIDFNSDNEIAQGTRVLVNAGSVSANAEYILATPDPVIGVSVLSFTVRDTVSGETYRTTELLIASVEGSRATGAVWEAGGFRYEEAATGATDHHLITAGGVKLYDLRKLSDGPEVRQRKHYEPFAGFDDGTTDDQIFAGSRLPPQGFCRLTESGVEYDYIALRDDSGGPTELFRIVKYTAGTAAHVEYTGILELSHCQDLSGVVSGSDVKLYCQMSDGTDGGKGVSEIDYQGAVTAQVDVTDYQLFGSAASGHRYEQYISATVAVHGDMVVLLANDTKAGSDDTGHYLFIYSLAAIKAAGDPLDVEPLTGPVAVGFPPSAGQSVLQGCAVNDDCIALQRGFVNPFQRKAVQFLDFLGNDTGVLEYAGILNDYTQAQLGDHGTLETLITQEPEGISWDDQGRLHVICQEEWHETGDVKSWEGANFTPRRPSVTSDPSAADDWVKTTAANSGAWAVGTHSYGTNYSRRAKVIHTIDKPLLSGSDAPLNNAAMWQTSVATVFSTNNMDAVVPLGNDYSVGGFAGAVSLIRNLFRYAGESVLRLYDAREGSDNSDYSAISVDRSGTRGILQLRARSALTEGAGINLYDEDDSSYPGNFRFWGCTGAGASVEAMNFSADDARWDRLYKIPQVIAATGARDAHTGDTSEHTFATVTIPGGSMGPNGFIRIRVQTGQTNNANNKTLRIKFDGNTVVTTTGSVTGSSATSRIVQVHNRNSESSQVMHGSSAAADPGETSVAVTTMSVDTSADKTLLITGQLTNSGDELALEAYSVEVCYLP